MPKSLYWILVGILIVIVGVSILGLLINWGIIFSPVVEPGETLPLLYVLVGASILDALGFLFAALRQKSSKMYLELIGIAVVHPSTSPEEVDNTYTEVIDFYNQHYNEDEMMSMDQEDELKMIKNEISKIKSLKYGKDTKVRETAETLVQ